MRPDLQARTCASRRTIPARPPRRARSAEQPWSCRAACAVGARGVERPQPWSPAGSGYGQPARRPRPCSRIAPGSRARPASHQPEPGQHRVDRRTADPVHQRVGGGVVAQRDHQVARSRREIVTSSAYATGRWARQCGGRQTVTRLGRIQQPRVGLTEELHHQRHLEHRGGRHGSSEPRPISRPERRSAACSHPVTPPCRTGRPDPARSCQHPGPVWADAARAPSPRPSSRRSLSAFVRPPPRSRRPRPSLPARPWRPGS